MQQIMSKEVLFIRVLQQEKNDEIRIGRTFTCYNLKNAEDSIVKGYNEKLS